MMNFRSIPARRILNCPDCRVPMWALEFQVPAGPLEVEHCGSCRGLFFDKGELEPALESQQEASIWIDRPELEAPEVPVESIVADGVFYRPCPVCQQMMSRVNFSRSSGVILDVCAQHGCWLDAGELKDLVLWWRAGGKEIHARRMKEAEAVARQPVTRRHLPKGNLPGPVSPPAPADSWVERAVVVIEIVGELIVGILD